jgi:hypothetical protein
LLDALAETTMNATTVYQASVDESTLTDPEDIKAPAEGDDITGQGEDNDEFDDDDEESEDEATRFWGNGSKHRQAGSLCPMNMKHWRRQAH